MVAKTLSRLTAACMLSSLCIPAIAQSVNPGVKGMQEIRLVVEGLDNEARACGITADSLDAAMPGAR